MRTPLPCAITQHHRYGTGRTSDVARRAKVSAPNSDCSLALSCRNPRSVMPSRVVASG
jgi:hypothetical protein